MDDPRNPYDVQPGQVWFNKDTRMQGQIIQILALELDREDPKAYCLIVTDQRPAYATGAGRHSHVFLRNFRPGRKGYRRLK